MILACLLIFPLTSAFVTSSACAGENSVAHVCKQERVEGDELYLDTSLTYAMKGSCICTINVTGVAIDVTLSVESGPLHCDAVLDFSFLEFIVKCGTQPAPISQPVKTLYVSWMKREAFRSTDICVKVAKTDATSAGRLSIACEAGGQYMQSTASPEEVQKYNSSFTTLSPEAISAAAASAQKYFESSLVIGILAGLIGLLFLLGLFVHFSDKRLKRKLAIQETARQTDVAAPVQAAMPPKRKEVVETRL